MFKAEASIFVILNGTRLIFAVEGNVVKNCCFPKKKFLKARIFLSIFCMNHVFLFFLLFVDIMDFKFYIISFEYLCETEQGEFLPCEVGLIEWSMNKGITKMLHRFINAGIVQPPRFTVVSLVRSPC